MSVVYRCRDDFFESLVGCESEQEMGRVVFPSLYPFLAHIVPRDCCSLQAIRGSLSLLSVCLLEEKTKTRKGE